MKTETLKGKLVNFSFVLPAFLLFSVFYIYPLFYTIWLSLHSGDAISFLDFVGLANFKALLFEDGKWWRSVYNAGFITFWALTFQNLLAFALALGVDNALKTGKIYRVIFFLLPVLSEIIIGLLMREMLYSGFNQAVLNTILQKIGLGFLAHDWFSSENVLTTVAIVHCWKGFGWGFIIFLAGLQSIPDQLYEAARVDGANSWQSFWNVTVPMMIPVTAMVGVLTILGTMQAFAMILALTRGAGGLTEVPVMRIYNHLKVGQVGYACTEGVVLGLMLVCISFIMLQVSKMLREKYGVT